jgi:hypothetical protein
LKFMPTSSESPHEAHLAIISATPVDGGSARQRRTAFNAVLCPFLVALTAFCTVNHMKSTDVYG